MTQQLYYDKGKLTKDIITSALDEARLNWSIWKKCYENKGSFGDLPVLAHDIPFQAFVYEFSVARGLKLHQVRAIRQHLKNWQPLTGEVEISGLLTEIKAAIRPTEEGSEDRQSATKRKPTEEWERLSMASKLLALWRPQKFPMWDQYAPAGLAILHSKTRGHTYSQKTVRTYMSFYLPDFHSLLDQCRADLDTQLTANEQALPGFVERHFDHILLKLGK